MSQQGSDDQQFTRFVTHIQGNVGPQVDPDSVGLIYLKGGANVTVTGDAPSHTLTITTAAARDATSTQKGVLYLATNAEAISGVDDEKAIVPSSLKAKLGDQRQHAIAIGAGTSNELEWEVMTDGQILVGKTGGDPKAVSLRSSDNTITVTEGSNSLDLKTGAPVATTFESDNAQTAKPQQKTLKILGGLHCTTKARDNVVTVDVNVPQARNATVLVRGVVKLASSGDTTAGTNQTAAVVPSGLKAKLGIQRTHGICYGDGVGEPLQWTAELEDGELLIGKTGGIPKKGAITSDSTLVITKGGNTLDLKVNAAFPKEVITNQGTAVPRNHQLTISGGTGIETEGSGENVFIRVDNTVATSFQGGSGTGATPASRTLKILGGRNIQTSASGDSVLIIGASLDGYATQFSDTKGGKATPVRGEIDFVAGRGLTSAATGRKVTYTLGSNICSSITADNHKLTASNYDIPFQGENGIKYEVKSNKIFSSLDATVPRIIKDDANQSTYAKSGQFPLKGQNGIQTTAIVDGSTHTGINLSLSSTVPRSVKDDADQNAFAKNGSFPIKGGDSIKTEAITDGSTKTGIKISLDHSKSGSTSRTGFKLNSGTIVKSKPSDNVLDFKAGSNITITQSGANGLSIASSAGALPFTYAAGLFSPLIYFAGTTKGTKYHYNYGFYRKFGNFVFAIVKIHVDKRGTPGANDEISIVELPFPLETAHPIRVQAVMKGFNGKPPSERFVVHNGGYNTHPYDKILYLKVLSVTKDSSGNITGSTFVDAKPEVIQDGTELFFQFFYVSK